MSANAHANTSALFLTVCAHSCKINYLIRMFIVVVLRLRSLLGDIMGCAVVCKHEVYTGLYSCLMSTLAADPFS